MNSAIGQPPCPRPAPPLPVAAFQTNNKEQRLAGGVPGVKRSQRSAQHSRGAVPALDGGGAEGEVESSHIL